jgi:hypothetical protein
MLNYSNGWFYFQEPFPYGTLTATPDSRTNTLLADLLPLFKKHGRILSVEDDELCLMYLSGACSRIEQWAMLPILPAAYLWSEPQPMPPDGFLFLPLRNAVQAGDQFGFDLLIAAKRITPPTTWPMHLEVGFAAGADVPLDLKLGIFELALALYELRSNPEMIDVYAQVVMNGTLSRYWVPRC